MISRSQDLHAYFTLDEVKRIHERMAEAGVRSRSAYFRKMALDGYIVKLDMDEISEMIRLLRISSNNLNQIAKHFNMGGIRSKEMQDRINSCLDVIMEMRKDVARLAEGMYGNFKTPGK